MRTLAAILVTTSLFAAPATGGEPAGAAAGKADSGQVDMAAMMAKAAKLTAPGPHHELLERFIGTWDTELRFTMPGMKANPEKGSATFSWLIDGRWLKQEATGTMFGRPTQSFMILGYDNFKMSYVTMMVGSVDTAMLTSEGDLDPSGEALISYGTLDEYLTGEHDKMVKYVWRFQSDDAMTLEVHDLPIGEENAKVFELSFRRSQR